MSKNGLIPHNIVFRRTGECSMNNIVLASGSPRRKELLSQVGIDFKVITSDADENSTKEQPGEYVLELSKIKAETVLNSLSEDAVVIGADTIVYFDGKVLGKPKDEEDAFAMIKAISGNSHQVYTGVCICTKDGCVGFYEKTDVFVYEMSDEEIWSYIKTGEPMDKAGAYGIQGRFAAYVKGIEGDYNNVVGLPVARLVHELKNMGVVL